MITINLFWLCFIVFSSIFFGIAIGMLLQTWLEHRKYIEEIDTLEKVRKYMSKRLMDEQIKFKKETEEVFEKIYLYRNKLIENGIELP